VLDAILDRVAAGDTVDELAEDYDLPVAAVAAVVLFWTLDSL
jgi:uncharacterized protein (DUF433 family)